ncbi:MAG: PhoX family phosphatase [Ahniella sp.]|nr:PhoX family phosphatase [Ahniella sp.]
MSHSPSDTVSNPGDNVSLAQVIQQTLLTSPMRRKLLLGGLGAAVLPFFAGCDRRSVTGSSHSDQENPGPESIFGFTAIPISSDDRVTVPAGYTATAFIPWGDPIRTGAPAFAPDATQSAADQAQQIGDNHDGMAYFGFDERTARFGDRSDEGLLAVNHEYINPEYLFAPGQVPENWLLPFTIDKAHKAQAAHGCSVVHVRRQPDGQVTHVLDSAFNRRVTGNTPIVITGPAAAHPLMQTNADPAGTEVLGMIGNCGNGRTPWGTYLTCEENFSDYFGWSGERTASSAERRYGLGQHGVGYLWHTVDPRFDLTINPNEPNRFGWIVEVDPFDPDSLPSKRTALGRFKHENSELVVAPNGKIVVYMGDDERSEYVYKFISEGTFDAAHPDSEHHRGLLDRGTLYVARFDAGSDAAEGLGRGIWIPLVHGQNGLTAENGFASQAEVLIRCRQAADRVGATMMDRPEWVAANPTRPGEVFVTLTNNDRRGGDIINEPDGSTPASGAAPPTDPANPRAQNVWGHIIRWHEAGGDHSALQFDWDIFVMAGQPANSGPRAPSANINADNLFNSPDGLAFDRFGRLWIQTDGKNTNSGDFEGMGNNQMLVADPASGEIRRFMVGPSGCEITGITWTPDRRTMFVNVQHPGEIGSHPRAPRKSNGDVFTRNDVAREPTAFSTWPTPNTRPRSATVVIRKDDGGVIGS